MTNFTCHSKSFINIFSTCQVSACEQQPFSCHNFANDIYSETAKTVFSHLNDAMRGFCGFNSITFSTHYKDNIEVLNRQRFTENPGVFFPCRGGEGTGTERGRGRAGLRFFPACLFPLFLLLNTSVN